MLERFGSELEFIARIKEDGSGTETVDKEHIEFLRKDSFKLMSLSITARTYIASEFHSFVVKLKNDPLKN